MFFFLPLSALISLSWSSLPKTLTAMSSMANKSPLGKSYCFCLALVVNIFICLYPNHNNPQNTHLHVKGGEQVPLGQDPESKTTAVRGCRQLIGKQHLKANINLNIVIKIKINIMIKIPRLSSSTTVDHEEEKKTFPEAPRNRQNVPCTTKHFQVNISIWHDHSCPTIFSPLVKRHSCLYTWLMIVNLCKQYKLAFNQSFPKHYSLYKNHSC